MRAKSLYDRADTLEDALGTVKLLIGELKCAERDDVIDAIAALEDAADALEAQHQEIMDSIDRRSTHAGAYIC